MDGNKGIIAAVLVILLLGAGFFFYNKQKTQTQIAASPEDLMASPASQASTEEATDSARGEEIQVSLAAQNNSTESGTAILKDDNGKTTVTLKIAGAPATAQPAHIHIGACPTPGAIKFPLTNVVNGISETTLDVSVSELKTMLPLAINIHKSAADIKTYVSCGDIK